VPVGGTFLDITGLNGSTIRHDLERRDFTINAMAIELSTARLLDCTGGQQDLSKKEVRMVSDGAFREDPVRLLRAFRLAAALEFSVEANTLSTIRRDAGELRRSAGERIRSELHQLLCCRNAFPIVALMADSGLFETIFQTPAPFHSPAPDHFQDIFQRLEGYLNHPPAVFTPRTTNTAPLPPDPGPWLKFASLLIHQHRDVPEHEAVSAIERICRRLHLSVREKNIVTAIARHHTRPLQLYNADTLGKLPPRDITRFFMDTDLLAPYLLLHNLAEIPDDTGRISRRGKTSFTDFAHRMLRHYHETFLPRKALPPFITGRDLSSRFSLSPSPFYKKILTRLEEARLSGETASRQEALDLAENLLCQFKS